MNVRRCFRKERQSKITAFYKIKDAIWAAWLNWETAGSHPECFVYQVLLPAYDIQIRYK